MNLNNSNKNRNYKSKYYIAKPIDIYKNKYYGNDFSNHNLQSNIYKNKYYKYKNKYLDLKNKISNLKN